MKPVNKGAWGNRSCPYPRYNSLRYLAYSDLTRYIVIANVDWIHHTENMTRLDMEVTSMLGAVQALIVIIVFWTFKRAHVWKLRLHLNTLFAGFLPLQRLGERKGGTCYLYKSTSTRQSSPNVSVWVSVTCDDWIWFMGDCCYLPIWEIHVEWCYMIWSFLDERSRFPRKDPIDDYYVKSGAFT